MMNSEDGAPAMLDGTPIADGPPGSEASARLVLGIETSCDETAVAIVSSRREILAECLLSQMAEHAPFGGVVPEIAARAHVERLDALVEQVLASSGRRLADLDGIAATAGPGLIGGLAVGLGTAKALALATDLPLLAINHLEAHALTPRLTHGIGFPYLLLLVSGGHCQLLEVAGVGRYRRLGTTIDDAAGEAFDKVAKMLGLGYPGGPPIEAAAQQGDPRRFDFPRPLMGQPGCDFSFSGLKTAVRLKVLELGERALEPATLADLCASFQAAVGDVLVDRTGRAIAMFGAYRDMAMPLVVAGGVAANGYLRTRLASLATSAGVEFIVPPVRLCSDNGVMVAWAGLERLAMGWTDALDVPARARWPLDPEAGLPALGRRAARAVAAR
jgi:N6-L-threonylcarbamoyladenine synthase